MTTDDRTPAAPKRHLAALTGLAVVGVAAVLAAREALVPICYWSGRWSLPPSSTGQPGPGQSHVLMPGAYLPENAPDQYWSFGLAIAWLVLWGLTAFACRRDAPRWLLFAPLVPFLATAWATSRMVYACNPF
jgi:hypothetical protein